ncbi:MYG1 family protein [Burkholderia ubonensis]|uniref:MYG1 family protein n=1 Tax=Burkholderia ubonensis TaxID=101571 RepID=UPI00075CDDB2|nr:MYG1 family protein [Burkholderia ubonensis]KVP17348.1 hypothetical protein WJ84_03710 [Burkholderia ubonensis]
MTTTIKLITHDRVAHADDTFAAAILRIAFGQVVVQRTRDPDILRMEAGAPGTFLLDVGGRYDPDRRLFDHHQPEGAGFRNQQDKEWPYATAGLVWKHYGEQAVRRMHPSLDDAGVDEIVQHIDDTVLKYIDAVDCGVRLKTAGPSLSALIASFNTAWYEHEEDIFPLVMDLAQVLLTNFIKRYAGKVFARDKVRQSIPRLDGRVLILEACIPWVTVVAEEMPDVLFVVYPVGDAAATASQWQLRAAVHPDMTPRIKLPQSWGGLERHALARVCGEREAVFCHRSRHLAGASSLEGALFMAEAAIREHHQCAELQAA